MIPEEEVGEVVEKEGGEEKRRNSIVALTVDRGGRRASLDIEMMSANKHLERPSKKAKNIMRARSMQVMPIGGRGGEGGKEKEEDGVHFEDFKRAWGKKLTLKT
ncbi:hypothetical protein TrLO_g4578 [Triparma laevis f. longispina]|nr:hypothetical protein TrLO_g4578 [Triparma laevis f. longispina]